LSCSGLFAVGLAVPVETNFQILDINVLETVEEVTINVVDNVIQVNINKITGTAVTNTSELINDGEDGVHPYITLLDLPSNLILYPTTVASDVSGYVKLVTDIHDPEYNVTAVNVSTGSITTTSQLISSLITVSNLINGNPGVFNISTIGNIRRTTGSGTAEFYFNIYKRDALGVETLIGVSNPTLPSSSAVYAEFNSTAIWDDGIFIDTDRIVLKFYANRISGGSNPTYEFQFGGITPVRTLVPIPLSVVPNNPTLQQVTDEGNVTTNPIDANMIYSNGNLIADEVGALISNNSVILKTSGTEQKSILSGNYINADVQEYYLPDKTLGTYFLATTDDIPSPITIDATPTDGSTNAVSSNGVFDALATKFELPSLTSGSVLFSNGSTIAQDNANLFWDDTNNRLGIGTTTPNAPLKLVYSNNTYDQGFKIRNSNTGITAITGMILEENSTGNAVATFSFYPSNYIVAAQRNTVVFASVATQKLGLQSNASSSGAAQDIWFSTFGTNATYQMQIKANGNIQINTNTDAGFRFDVNGTARVQGQTQIIRNDANSTGTLIIRNTSTTGANFILLGEDAANKNLGFGWHPSGASTFNSLVPNTAYMYVLSGASKLAFNTTTSSQPITFCTNDWNERMRIFGGGNVMIGGGNTPTDIASSKLTIESTTQGFLPPRMTTVQKNAIASPVAGLVVYDSTLNKLCVRTASTWETITSL